MTPFQFAKEQCSNYQADGSCLGVGIRDNGRLYSFGKKAKCLLADGQRCQFFEDCVLPMGFEDPIKRQQASEMKADYLHSIGVTHKGRVCPQCNMRILAPRARLCGQCAVKNRRAAAHAARDSKTAGRGGS